MARTFSAKRGHYINEETVEEALEEVFGEYEKEGETYVVKDFEAFKRIETSIIDNGSNKDDLQVETEADMDKADRVPQTKPALNDFLEEATGYTPEGRKEAMEREVKGS